MRILHILPDGPDALASGIIELQSADNEVKVLDLTSKEISFGSVVDEIASCDRVVSW